MTTNDEQLREKLLEFVLNSRALIDRGEFWDKDGNEQAGAKELDNMLATIKADKAQAVKKAEAKAKRTLKLVKLVWKHPKDVEQAVLAARIDELEKIPVIETKGVGYEVIVSHRINRRAALQKEAQKGKQ